MDIRSIAQKYFISVPDYSHLNVNIKGCYAKPYQDPCFVEPGLSMISKGKDEAKVWLFSAPGAMGKSVYARRLAETIGAIYINLAEARTIGSGYITDILVDSDLMQYQKEGRIALIFDALDEAFLRVTFESRIDFFDNLLKIFKNNLYPTLIFGRSAAIDEAALILEDRMIEQIRLSLNYFTRSQAIDLVTKLVIYKSKLKSKSTAILDNHHDVFVNIANNLLDMLDSVAGNHDEKFSGYAPVLDAVATFFCETPNYSSINLDNFANETILQDICHYILQREQDKFLDQLNLSIKLYRTVYDPKQQMQALAWISSGLDIREYEFDDAKVPENMKKEFDQATREFIEQHPFLVAGKHPVNAVFAGAIQSFSLKYSTVEEFIFSGTSPSPLLTKFYFNDDMIYEEKADKNSSQQKTIPAIHVPWLLTSTIAFIPADELLIFSMNQDKSEDPVEIDISITDNKDKFKSLYKFNAQSNSSFVFTQQGISWIIDGHDIDVKFTANGVFCMLLPVSIDVKIINFDTPELQIIGNGIASFLADRCISSVQNIKTYGNLEIIAGGQGFGKYPWPTASEKPVKNEEPTREQKLAFFSFCRIIRSFRSHSKGRLARFDEKLEHARMVKNYGDSIIKWLIENRIIEYVRNDRMYYLDAEKLGSITGSHYDDVIKFRASTQLWSILKKLVK